MMKLFAVLLVVLVTGTAIDAQSLEIIAAKKTFTIERADSTWHDFSIGAKNISSKPVPARVRVDKSRMAASHRVKFCFAMECYDESTTVSSATGGVSTIAPGDADTSTFFGEFRADGLTGSSIAAFTFFSNTNADDKASVELVFNVGGTASVETAADAAGFLCTPNPATDAVTLSVDPALGGLWTIDIIDINGNVRSTPVRNADAVTLSVADLATGVYTIVVRTGQNSRTSRLVVVH
ncbi:MAG: T9SS type A sorting domain-containing protein [Candidatus Kapaibacterium sp.]